MRAVLLWSSHSNSTFNVASAYSKAFRRAGMQIADFVYSQELILQNLAINAFRGTKDESYDGEAILLSNRLLMGYVASALPHAIIICTGLDLYKSAWKWLHDFRRELRHPYKIITIFTESPYRPSEELELAHWSDYVYTNDLAFAGRLRKIQPRTWYLPQAYDDKLHTPKDMPHKYGTYMCGSGFKSRLDLLERVDWESTGSMFTLRGLWPDIKEGTPLFPYYHEGLVKNEDVVDDYRASDICLNLHRQEGEMVIFERDLPDSYSKEKRTFAITDAYSMNNRTCEIAAAGGFQIVDDSRAEVAEVFGDSVPRFGIKNPGELQDMIAYYTHRPEQRAKLSQEARLRIEGRTYLANAQQILSQLGG